MKNTLIIAVACLLGGGAVGYFAGQSGEEDAGTSSSDASTLRVAERERADRGSGQGDSQKDERSYDSIVKLPGQTTRIQALIDLYSDLDPSEFAAEADKLQELPFSERIMAAYILFAAWAEVSPYDAVAHANSKMGFAGNFVKPTILQSWAATDPSGAASYFKANRGEFSMMGMMGGRRGGGQSGAAVIAGEWAKQDPEGALAWAKTLDGREKTRATSGALTQLAKTDPAKAAQMAGELGEDAGGRTYASIAGEWAKQDWSATQSWIQGLPEDQQGRAMGSAIRSLAGIDPARAAQEALALSEGETRNNAFEDVAGAMAKTDASGAIKWVMTNGSEESQREAVGDVMQSWVNQDREGALEWINGQSEGSVRDEAVQSYVFNDHSGGGAEAVNLAETIGDERSRGRAVRVAAFRWLNQDKDAASSYIESSEALSDRAKERMLRRAGVEQ